uniref:C2H2-type domain-containing protein n=1 Tax=Trichuris muris TaxID=70415 RepID=A0A5S6QG26_TRIMR
MEEPHQDNQQSVPERTTGGDEANGGIASYPGPFRCVLCGFVTSTGHRCGRSFLTINSVASHYGRWCTGPQGLRIASTEIGPAKIAVNGLPPKLAGIFIGERLTLLKLP